MSNILETFWPVILLGAVLFALRIAHATGLINRLFHVTQDKDSKPFRRNYYKSRGSLLTDAESYFFQILDAVIPDDCRVFAKVRLADLFEVDRSYSQNFQASFNRIQSKHVDYVICKKDDHSIQLLIELDDKSHDKQDRIERDKFIDDAVSGAGLQILRIPVQKSYNADEISELILRAITDKKRRKLSGLEIKK